MRPGRCKLGKNFTFVAVRNLRCWACAGIPEAALFPILGRIGHRRFEIPPGTSEITDSEPYDKCVVTFESRNPLLCIMKRQRRNDILVEQVIERLKSIRRTRGLTQENVRFDTDLNIGRIESGRHSISLTTLADLCDYYGISLEEFFKEIETQRQA